MSLSSFSKEAEGRWLYRGIGAAAWEAANGQLVPKETGAFEHVFQFDGTIRADGSATFGPSVTNAVLRHQLHQEGFPTSGISTTPRLARARFYALGRRQTNAGLVLKIDRLRLEEAGVQEYVVAEWVADPSIPEDEEVILVAGGGPLPAELIVEIIPVSPSVSP